MDNILKIIPQSGEHDDAIILGDVAALTALRNAIDTAIKSTESNMNTMQTDGEWYTVYVYCHAENMGKETAEYFAERGY